MMKAQSRSIEGFAVTRLTTAAGPARMMRRSIEIDRDGKTSYAFYMLQINPGDNDTICLLVPGDFVNQRALHFEDRCARGVSAEQGLPRLFCDSLVALEREALQLGEQEFLSAIRTISELAILAVIAPEDLAGPSTSVVANHLAHAKRVIRQRLANPTLTLADVACECGLSLGYLHKLFRQDGRSMSDYLMNERLQHAWNLLRYAPATQSVTDVCFASGFSNASHFSTAFRRAFRVSPRDVLQSCIPRSHDASKYAAIEISTARG